jgi:hypothetical protein
LADGIDRPPSEIEAVLTGTTLRVYRFMISKNEPVGPREVQRSLHFSSPGLASFHLEKLARSGLISKDNGGAFTVNRVYLKHYVRFRRYLIPRYMFYATLSTAFLVGWAIILLAPSTSNRTSFLKDLHGTDAVMLIIVAMYGIVVTMFATIVLWFETAQVLKHDKL